MKISQFVLFLYLSYTARSQVVCSLEELVRELKEDLNDNGRLDCLRENFAPLGKVETEEEKEKRAAAIWEGDCSFEAQNDGEADWLKMVQDYYGLTKGLVDVQGNSVDKDFEYQADMCEIIRAFAANNKFPQQFEMSNIPLDITEHIKCVGKTGQSEICAVTAFAFNQQKGWQILLKGQSINFNQVPKWKVAPEVTVAPSGEQPLGSQITKF